MCRWFTGGIWNLEAGYRSSKTHSLQSLSISSDEAPLQCLRCSHRVVPRYLATPSAILPRYSFTVPFSTGFVISLYAPFACVWSSTWVLATWHTVSWSMTQPRGVRWRYSGVDSFVIWKILWWQALENKGRFWKRIRIIKLSVNFEIYNNRLNC